MCCISARAQPLGLPIMAAQHSQHQPAPAHPHPHAANQASGNCSSNSHSNSSPDDDDFSWITSQDLVTLKEMGDESGLRPQDAVLRQHIKTLPKGSKPVRFVGEGAANAVFEFRVPEASRLAPGFKGWHHLPSDPLDVADGLAPLAPRA